MKYLIPLLCAGAFIAVNAELAVKRIVKRFSKKRNTSKYASSAKTESNAIKNLRNTFPDQSAYKTQNNALIININRKQQPDIKLREKQLY